MKLIVNADDFGFSESVNKGIIDGYKNGIVTSTTMMMNMPAVEHACSLYEKNQEIGLGVHLNLTTGRPISDNVPSLIKDSGEFHNVKDIENNATKEDAYKEMKAQIEKFISYGFSPTHLDSHHHISYEFSNFKEIIFILAKEYNLPIRTREKYKLEARNNGIRTIDYFIEEFRHNGSTKENFEDLLKQCPKDSIVEVMTHPGYMDEETMKRTSYNMQREQDLKELIKLKNSEVLSELGVEFINYNFLK